jgi:hypothetical protein
MPHKQQLLLVSIVLLLLLVVLRNHRLHLHQECDMTVIGFAYFNAILLNDVCTTALDDAIGRDDF